jgi:hypothetical protein
VLLQITDLLATAAVGASKKWLAIIGVVEWALVKSPMFTMVATSFLFSFSRVYNDFPFKSLLYFAFPYALHHYPVVTLIFRVIIFVALFYNELCVRVPYYSGLLRSWLSSEAGRANRRNSSSNAVTTVIQRRPPTALVDIDSVVHMCSQSPRESHRWLFRTFFQHKYGKKWTC